MRLFHITVQHGHLAKFLLPFLQRVRDRLRMILSLASLSFCQEAAGNYSIGIFLT